MVLVFVSIISIILIWSLWNKTADNMLSNNNIDYNNPNGLICFAQPNDEKISKIQILEPKLKTEDIVEFATANKKFIFRPKTLDEFIGQNNAKGQVELTIKQIKVLKRPFHIFLSALQGHGKTTLAKIIGNLLDADFIERIASQVKDEEDVIDIVNTINVSIKPYTIIFLDEIHIIACKPELFYTAMEDFQLAGKTIKPFIMIGATTEKDVLVDKFPAFMDRFHVKIDLQRYTIADIVSIITQYKNQLYSEFKFEESKYEAIAKNCKLTPRIAIELLGKALVEKDINKVFKYNRIIKDGLTDTDVKILNSLYSTDKAIGESALAQKVGLRPSQYRIVYEPFLVEQGYINRTQRGRVIEQKGIEFLGKL